MCGNYVYGELVEPVPSTSDQKLRENLLYLVHTPDKDPHQSVAEATVLEEFVLGNKPLVE